MSALTPDFTPAVEIGWRLAREHWGLGYASEAAWTALRCGFDRLQLDEIVGLHHREPICHHKKSCRPSVCITIPRQILNTPKVAADDPLRPHVLYRITRAQWLDTLHG